MHYRLYEDLTRKVAFLVRTKGYLDPETLRRSPDADTSSDTEVPGAITPPGNPSDIG
jgi:hypothetical protein